MEVEPLETLFTIPLRIMPTPVGYSGREESLQDGLAWLFLLVGLVSGLIVRHPQWRKWTALAGFVVLALGYLAMLSNPSLFWTSTVAKAGACLCLGFLFAVLRKSDPPPAGEEERAPPAQQVASGRSGAGSAPEPQHADRSPDAAEAAAPAPQSAQGPAGAEKPAAEQPPETKAAGAGPRPASN